MCNTLQLLKTFCRCLFVERDVEGLLALLSKDVCWLGNTKSEDVSSLEQARVYFTSEVASMPGSYKMVITDERQLCLGAASGSAMVRLQLSCGDVSSQVGAIVASKPEDGIEKLCSLQLAVIDAVRQPGEDYLATKAKAKLAREKMELILSTMPGGLLGEYMQPGFPFYFINDRMLAHLGYEDEAEFVAHTDGMVLNCIHPEDRSHVSAAVDRQIAETGRYSVDERMLKKDGSYVWMHEMGKRSVAENGEDVIISVCYDITEERAKQSQLDNLLNVLPGGVALYQMENGRLNLLYQSDGLGMIAGYSPAEYALLMRDGGRSSVYSEDVDRVFAAIDEVLSSDKTITLDYRVPHRDGGYVWISGSFKSAGVKDGCPVLHAVFTEMAQMRELMGDIVENSGVGVIVTDNATHELLYANAEALKIHSKCDCDYEGKLCYQYLLGLDQPCEFCRGLPPEFQSQPRETYIPALDHYYLTQGGLVSWAGREAHIEYLTDITETKKAQQQLHDVIHNVPGGICLYRWNGKKLLPIIVSEQFSTLLGEDAQPVLERVAGMGYEHAHPEDLPALQKAMVKAFTTTGKMEHTYRSWNSKLKEYLWLYVQGVAVPQTDGTQLVYVSYTDVTRQHLTELQLRASERALDFATEEAGLWHWQYDPALECAYFSQRCMRDFGLPAVLEHFPQSWLDAGFVAPEYSARYLDAVQKIKSGESQVRFEAQIKDGSGELHWAELRFSNPSVEGRQQELVVCTARIIDYEKALAAKYEMEKQKPTLGNQSLLFHAVFNLTSGSVNDYGYIGGAQHLSGDYTSFSSMIRHILGAIIDPDAQKKFARLNTAEFLIGQHKQGNQSFSMDYRRRLPDGRILWVRNILQLVSEPDTRNVLLFEYCYNIHQQKMADELLHTATVYDYERLSSVDFATGQMVSYGQRTGDSADAVLDYIVMRDAYIASVVLPEEQEDFRLATEPETVTAQVAQHGSYVFTTRIRKADGTDGVVKTRFVPYDTEHQLYIMSRTDVTDLLRGEEAKNVALHEALSLANQANRAKSDFLSSMSHDIRTPMNAIVGMCELALADESDSVQVHDSLETIRSSSALLLALINNILDMSRIESGKMTLTSRPFSITQEVGETVETFKSLAEQKNQTFHSCLNVRHDRCMGDAARIHSALDNILSNAIKYTPNGGTITYRISELPSERPEIGLYRFEISDTGIGISEEQQKHLFEPFYRGESSMTALVEGTGLGLSISKAIIDLKGGTICVNSAESGGTTFVVDLPLHLAGRNAELPSTVGPAKTADTPDLAGLHILLCEDHPVNQKVAVSILKKAGAAVTVAQNGQAGLNLFLQRPAGTFDLILMDIQMPVMNGYEAARAIRESGRPQARQIPIIAMTANAFAEDVQKSISAGMDAHLAKPVVSAQLYAAVLQYTGRLIQAEPVKQKVLFVDDVELNIAVLTLAINDEYEIFVARNGEEALATLENNPDIAAVITDIMMPGIDGITLIKTIRANSLYRNMAVLANTQYGDAKQEEELRALGADDFLYKPTTPEVVQSRLREVLRKYRRRP